MTNHDRIVSFVAGKLQKLGFTIKCIDGKYDSVTHLKVEIPPKLSTHRPDIYGIKDAGVICIGEAKMPNDLATQRTKTQLMEFTREIRLNSNSLLIIGVPQGSKQKLIELLNKIGVVINSQIDIMEIPYHFLNNNAEI
jgi:hypothetical protein